ncbi:DUF3040 domain-containing protein [Demequina sp. NBRC 110057]|uniref:DUF3040 domain-containing protein n=1 Tax=Demequina sp. NBRC 110057 TaxID=1570346 RepID=UPI0013565BAF|nr:DUF3040 domain-containing protein [Demequina sp. NBRC 110057]
MPLSEYEQRVLDQLEHDLGQDASLHRAMNKGPKTPARIVAGVAGVVIGLGIVLLGVVTQIPVLGVFGFLIMAGVALWALLTPRKGQQPAAPQKKPSAGPQAPKQRKDFMQTFEERFDRRRESGDL